MVDLRGAAILIEMRLSERRRTRSTRPLAGLSMAEVRAMAIEEGKFAAELEMEIALLREAIGELERQIDERLVSGLEGLRLSPEQDARVAAAKDDLAEVSEKFGSLSVRDK
ncbi:hypothetical protein EJ06DRAFT_559458 [Trichodelitschia bisporula]|uniref:Uncharacterized protein n=1 Tax=Trichodelitschia bisporula TaxID=703511 RepID=A0A6G1HL66_9PEZI|nr:hypothetical protein EJ06DRAFT_559458 [Trichodelitschia bisporula]